MKYDDVIPSVEEGKCLPEQTCYLAGPMEFAEEYGLAWRLEYQEQLNRLNIHSIIPEHEEIARGGLTEKEVAQLKIDNPEDYKEYVRENFIKPDLKFVRDSDMVIVRWEGEQISGTAGEAQEAYLSDVPVYLVSSREVKDIPGWLYACSTEHFKSLSCLLLYLTKQSFYRGTNERMEDEG